MTATPRDLVFVSMEDWDDVWRRNQFVCAGLARRYPQMKILFVGLPHNVSNAVRHGRVAALLPPAIFSPPGLPNITVTKPLKLFPDSAERGRLANEALFRRHIRRCVSRLGLAQPTLWLNPHHAIHIAVHLRGEHRGIIYDITDDWTQLTQSPRMTALTEEQDRALCSAADAVIVCSERLEQLKTGMADRLIRIPNGVDAAHYRAVTEPGPLPAAAAGWTKPVLGYVGTIHPDRVDVALLLRLAGEFRNGTIALVGPDFLSPADRQRLIAAGNVAMTGPVPYAAVPQYMRAFDVCMTPHVVSEFTESLNPIKLWEYLAAGKPIVSTNVAGFRDYPALVRIADTHDAFVAAARDAIAEGSARAAERRAAVADHSWDARLDAIEHVLAEVAAAPARREAVDA